MGLIVRYVATEIFDPVREKDVTQCLRRTARVRAARLSVHDLFVIMIWSVNVDAKDNERHGLTMVANSCRKSQYWPLIYTASAFIERQGTNT